MSLYELILRAIGDLIEADRAGLASDLLQSLHNDRTMIIIANDTITFLYTAEMYELAEEIREVLAAEPTTSSIPTRPQNKVTSACQASTSSKRTADETVDVDEMVSKKIAKMGASPAKNVHDGDSTAISPISNASTVAYYNGDSETGTGNEGAIGNEENNYFQRGNNSPDIACNQADDSKSKGEEDEEAEHQSESKGDAEHSTQK
uniref:Uncharacterized protein n=1 Tax=Ditylenchus dipsaci TaxID=166011 RepID=A0A915CU75_9BILA